jgi:hypothetical protein
MMTTGRRAGEAAVLLVDQGKDSVRRVRAIWVRILPQERDGLPRQDPSRNRAEWLVKRAWRSRRGTPVAVVPRPSARSARPHARWHSPARAGIEACSAKGRAGSRCARVRNRSRCPADRAPSGRS